MADITRLSRFVGGLPRDVDMSTNTLQVSSLKVGSTTPIELTKVMAALLADINTGSAGGKGLPTANLADGAVTGAKLNSNVADGSTINLAMIAGVDSAGSALTPSYNQKDTEAAGFSLSGEPPANFRSWYVEPQSVASTVTSVKVGTFAPDGPASGIMKIYLLNEAQTETESLLSSTNFNTLSGASETTIVLSEVHNIPANRAISIAFLLNSVNRLSISNYSTVSTNGYNINGVTGAFYSMTPQPIRLCMTVYTSEFVAGVPTYNLAVKNSGISNAHIAANAVTADKLAASAKQSTLESKLAALRVGVLGFAPTVSGTSDVVTTQVLGAAATDVAVGAGAGVGVVAAKGIFVGTVGGASDIGKVLIRVNGTDNGFDDGSGDEIYGVLSESAGVYTLAYKKHDGTPYTIQASDVTATFDFYFVEVMDLYSFGVDRFLLPAIGGVVDATTASSVFAESTARANADSTLQSNIDSEATARANADSTLQSNINSEITARSNADSTLQSNIDSEATARANADSTLQSSIDSEATARANADSTLQSNINSEITARSNADSTLQSNIDSEATARMNADSTLQSNLQSNIDSEATARANADSTLQSHIDSEATARANADSTLQFNLQSNIDSEATARANADSTLQSNIDSEITARSNADSTLQSNIDSEATARANADSTLQSSINSEITARMNADSTLQLELDTTQGSLGAAVDGDGGWLGFAGTNYLDAELTMTTSFEALDSAIGSEVTARSNADSTLQSAINSEITARMNADSTLQAQLSAINVSVIDVLYVAATGGIAAGDVVALSPTVAGEVVKADASALATSESVVGVATETKTAGQSVNVRTFGIATVTTDGTNFDLGKRVYAHIVAGQASKTSPSATNNVVYLLGGAAGTNTVFVNPNLEYVVT